MKKVFYYICLVLTILTWGTFIWNVINTVSKDKLSSIVALLFEALVLGILTIMLEPRPRITEEQRKKDDSIKDQGLVLLLTISIIAAFLMFF